MIMFICVLSNFSHCLEQLASCSTISNSCYTIKYIRTGKNSVFYKCYNDVAATNLQLTSAGATGEIFNVIYQGHTLATFCGLISNKFVCE